jgi:hypothetical protein
MPACPIWDVGPAPLLADHLLSNSRDSRDCPVSVLFMLIYFIELDLIEAKIMMA